MSEGEFKEGRRHWWLSRVVVPVVIPLTVGLVGLGGLLYVNAERGDDEAEAAPADPPSSQMNEGDPQVGYGWGPNREMYTLKEPSPTATFNSIINNPAMGDERNFVRCRIADDPDMKFGDEVFVADDTEIEVYIWIDNSSVKPDQKIEGAYIDLLLNSPTDRDATVNVHLNANNAPKVWNGCRVTAPGGIELSYIPGTAELYTYGNDPMPLRDGVVRNRDLLPGIRGNRPGEIGGNSDNYGYIKLRVTAFLS